MDDTPRREAIMAEIKNFMEGDVYVWGSGKSSEAM